MWIRWIWDRYEVLFGKILGLQSLGPESLLRVRCITYRGRPLYTGDQAILPGMRVLDLHLDNRRTAALDRARGAAVWALRRRWQHEMTLLHHAFQDSYGQASGVVATTLLAGGFRDLGFHVAALPGGLWRWWLTLYFRWLQRVYRPVAPPSRRRRPERNPVMLWLTYEELERLVNGTGPQVLEPPSLG